MAEKFSVAWWRQLFVDRSTIPRAELESLAGVSSIWQSNPQGQEMPGLTNGAAKNLLFAGDLVPTSTMGAPGAVLYRLAGPNGMTPAEMLSPEYHRADDDTYNAAADYAPGYTIVQKSAVGFGTFDVPEYGASRPAALRALFEKDGGVRWQVAKNPVYPGYEILLFRGTGFTSLGTTARPSNLCATARVPFDAEIQLAQANYATFKDDDYVAPGVSKLGIILAIKVRGNASVTSNGCPVPYPEATGYSENATENTTRTRGNTTPAVTGGGTPANTTTGIGGVLPIGNASPMGVGPSTIYAPNGAGGDLSNQIRPPVSAGGATGSAQAPSGLIPTTGTVPNINVVPVSTDPPTAAPNGGVSTPSALGGKLPAWWPLAAAAVLFLVFKDA